MPTKSVPGYTQQPVLGSDFIQLTFQRQNGQLNYSAVYEVRDETGAIRFTDAATGTTTVGSALHATFASGLLSAANVKQGTS